MRLKKLISSSLAIGLLFNSASPSLASVISEYGRYETFEGNNITIDNMLEEDKVDIEIEGNTLVNLIGDEFNITNINTTTVNQDKSIIFEHAEVSIKRTKVTFDKAIVDINKTYTLFFNILENTLYRGDSDTNVAKFNIVNYNVGTHIIKPGDIGIQKIVLKQPHDITHNGMPYLEVANESLGKLVINNIVLLEGDFSDYDIPYFEGIKSVGELENNKIEISSQNKNLWNGTYEIGSIDTGELGNGGLDTTNGENRKRSYYIPVKPNTKYTISQKDYNDIINDQIFIHQYDKNKNNILWNEGLTYRGVRENLTFTTDSNAYYLRFRTEDNRDLNPNTIMIEKGSIATPIVSSQSAKKEISLLEPLRGLPNGVKDRIIKRNGQWVIERNCEKIVLDGTENWFVGIEPDGWDVYDDSIVVYTYSYAPKANSSFICDTLPYIDGAGVCVENVVGATNQSWDSVGHISIRLPYSYLETTNLNGFIKWLSENTITVVYQLDTPIYEPLNIDLSINLFKDITYISNNSAIPANLKITVDRAVNRAIEAIELAKTNPTVANISQARMWSNLLKESVNKDKLHSEINNITDIEDLQLERKTATSNIDVYIKSENMLLMSLSTNSITFNDFSGVNDMKLNNAVNISINSSLPYQLNSYLLSEIENSDKSSRIEKDLLNIKVNDDSDYKTFADINEKLVLEDGCDAGNNKSHSIDLRLKGSQAHKADIYKTVIKFEAEQK